MKMINIAEKAFLSYQHGANAHCRMCFMLDQAIKKANENKDYKEFFHTMERLLEFETNDEVEFNAKLYGGESEDKLS